MIHISREPTVSFIVFFTQQKLYVTCPVGPFSLILEKLKEEDGDGELVVSVQQQDGSFTQTVPTLPVWGGAVFRVDYPPKTLTLQKKGDYYVIKGTPLCLDRERMTITGYLMREVHKCEYRLIREPHPLINSYVKRYGLRSDV
jgi:hypothetical protein